jgi:quercetin dioxygenase-like cupin family protein
MVFAKWSGVAAAALLLVSCQAQNSEPTAEAPSEGPLAQMPDRPNGSNLILRTDLEQADNLEVIVSDVVIPPGAQVPRHTHPGEEFVYIIEGSATHIEEGLPDIELKAGDSHVIRPGAAHEPIGGPEGARAIVFRVHVKGEPERTPAPN